jgi:hypothetical protein
LLPAVVLAVGIPAQPIMEEAGVVEVVFLIE